MIAFLYTCVRCVCGWAFHEGQLCTRCHTQRIIDDAKHAGFTLVRGSEVGE